MQQISTLYTHNSALFLGTAEELGLSLSSFTLEAWVYPSADSLNGTWGIFGEATPVSPDSSLYGKRLGMYLENGLPTLSFYGSNFQTAPTSENYLPVERWSHVAFRYDLNAQELAVFINGQLVARKTGVAPYEGNGSMYWARAFNQSFTGHMAEVRLWDGARSSAQIQTDQYTIHHSNPDGLRLYLPLTEGSGEQFHYMLEGIPHFVDLADHFGMEWLTVNQPPTHNALQQGTAAQFGKYGAHITATPIRTTKIRGMGAWVKIDSNPTPTSPMPVVGQWAGGLGWELSVSNLRPMVRVTTGDQTVMTAQGVEQLPLNTWVQLEAAHWDNSVILYVNGHQVAKTQRPPDASSGPWPNPYTLHIGSVPAQGRTFYGAVAEVLLSHLGRNERTIRQHLYQSWPDTPEEYVDALNSRLLRAYYRLDATYSATEPNLRNTGGEPDNDPVYDYFPDATLHRVFRRPEYMPVNGRQPYVPVDRKQQIKDLWQKEEDLTNDLTQQQQDNAALALEVGTLNASVEALQASVDQKRNELLAQQAILEAALAEADAEHQNRMETFMLKGYDILNPPEPLPDDDATDNDVLRDFILRTHEAIKTTESQLQGSRTPYSLGNFSLDFRFIPVGNGAGMILPTKEQLQVLSEDQLSTLQVNFVQRAANSAGALQKTVPNVTGTTRSEAQRILENAGLRMKAVTDVSPDARPGLVTRQQPQAGNPLTANAIISVFVGATS